MESPASPAIGIEIVGGLGNQMFEYAAALSLSQRLGAELACDTYLPEKDASRPLGLREFGLRWTEVRGPRRRGPLRAVGRALGLGGSQFARAAYFEEQEGRFNPEFLQLKAPCFLKGYFQSWRYFEGHEEAVRAAFDPDKLPVGGSGAMEAKIRGAAYPVAVHVRRGDFSDTEANAALRGPLTPDYYRQARSIMAESVPDPTFFLFSDEPQKAMAELSDWPALVPIVGMTPHEDFRLMALCRHFIIANSTFSWWGAWLGKSPEKIVVAPTKWFGPAYRHELVVADLALPDWLLIDPKVD